MQRTSLAVTVNGLLGTGCSANVTWTLWGPFSSGINLLLNPFGLAVVNAGTCLPDGLVTVTLAWPLPAPAVRISNGTSLPTVTSTEQTVTILNYDIATGWQCMWYVVACNMRMCYNSQRYEALWGELELWPLTFSQSKFIAYRQQFYATTEDHTTIFYQLRCTVYKSLSFTKCPWNGARSTMYYWTTSSYS